ncbi:hypothetical protein CYK37_20800 [Mesorhizobium loti]|nr:hypothetical protein CYK37_20800 [Mesorhizobium loti]
MQGGSRRQTALAEAVLRSTAVPQRVGLSVAFAERLEMMWLDYLVFSWKSAWILKEFSLLPVFKFTRVEHRDDICGNW